MHAETCRHIAKIGITEKSVRVDHPFSKQGSKYGDPRTGSLLWREDDGNGTVRHWAQMDLGLSRSSREVSGEQIMTVFMLY